VREIEEIIRQEADTAVACAFPTGHTVFRQGEVALGIYFMQKGRARVVRNATTIGEIGPNQFLAEADLLDDKPRSASVITTQPAECLLFTRDTFLRLMEEHPELSLHMARKAAAAAKPPDARPGVKSTVQNKLVETFEGLYALKAFTRFSVAVLGCPVEVSGAAIVEVIQVGEVKVIVLMAADEAELSISARGAGSFQLQVLRPEMQTVCLDPVSIQADDRFILSLPQVRLERVA
jgi:hypothetical protein